MDIGKVVKVLEVQPEPFQVSPHAPCEPSPHPELEPSPA